MSTAANGSGVAVWRLHALRAMYLLMAVGLAVQFGPDLVAPKHPAADPSSVVRALLGAIGLLSLLGLRHPLRMLPLLMFELAWKTIWVLATAWPLSRAGALGTYGDETLVACIMGIVLTGAVIPWGHVWRCYVIGRSEPWTRATPH